MKSFVFATGLLAATALAGSAAAQTVVPGQQGRDGPVNGHYTQTIEYEESGVVYTCEYVVNYRGDFGDDPYLDDGWIQNHINCTSSEGDHEHYNYNFVNETDPRYTGDPDWAIWGNWEWTVFTANGQGNAVKNGH